MTTPAGNTGFRNRLAGGGTLRGLFVCIPHFQVAEALSHSGLDFLMIEAEHGATDLPLMHMQVAAMADRKPVLVRIGPCPPDHVVKPILDLGVAGLMVADVRDADEARAIVAQTRFAPQGTRGIGGSIRASHYGQDMGYFRDGPAEPIAVIAQIESPEGLDNIAEIADVDGVDAVFFGPMDLSSQMGHPADPGHPEVQAAIRAALETLVAQGSCSGILCAPDKVAQWQALGVSLFLVGSDIGMLNGSVRAALQT